jgi:hypothetical protein
MALCVDGRLEDHVPSDRASAARPVSRGPTPVAEEASMLDTRVRIRVAAAPVPTIRGPRSRLELELREMAEDLAGCLDRDELCRDDEQLIADAMDAAVLAALPVVLDVLDRELTPRLEDLPVKTRVTLARARRRRDYGMD